MYIKTLDRAEKWVSGHVKSAVRSFGLARKAPTRVGQERNKHNQPNTQK